MSAAAPTRHWAQMNEVTSVAGIRFLLGLFRLAGRLPFVVCLYPALVFYFLTNPRGRAASRAYLTRLQRSTGSPAGRITTRMVFQHFVSFADSILDSLLVWSGTPNTIRVEKHDQRVLTGPIASGRGGVIITAHVGNISLCRGLSADIPGLTLHVLTHTKHAAAFNRLLADLNPQSAVNLMQVTDLSADVAMHISERVAQGEFVVIAGDRVPVATNPRVAVTGFLGAPAAFPVGPYVLASILHCPTYLLFCLKREDGYHVYYELFREEIRLPRGAREEALTALAGAYASRLAHYCSLAPLQWFNFHDFWAPPPAGSTDGSH